jgi:hypothetical protein
MVTVAGRDFLTMINDVIKKYQTLPNIKQFFVRADDIAVLS